MWTQSFCCVIAVFLTSLLVPTAVAIAQDDRGPLPEAVKPVDDGRPGDRVPGTEAELIKKDTLVDEGELSELDELMALDLDQLADAEVLIRGFSDEVTTVDRSKSTVGRSPTAVFVITGKMIRRSGSRSVPEALRMAPGVQVAHIDANKWAISARGFNGRFANKLLVQIDGRTVYTPLFAGVYWDAQDVLLEDVDRIEVIRGPGATVWGANAVNGVVNIITKSAKDTIGVFAEGGVGNQRDFASARVGGLSTDGDLAWRIYGKWFDRDAGSSPIGTASDDWRSTRFGFRTDWQTTCCDTLTFQGGVNQTVSGEYSIAPTQTVPFVLTAAGDEASRGGNALFRWTHEIDEDSDWSLQCYYDRTERTLRNVDFREDRDTVDLDFQHRFAWGERHSTIWGGGYRNTKDRIRNSFNRSFSTNARADDLFSLFLQDDTTISEDLLHFIIGSKFQWNDYTKFEIQPTARLLYTPTDRRSLWASFSRAVRVPSRGTDDAQLITPPVPFPVNPTFPTIQGNRGLESEEVLAWEAGIREAPSDDFFWDAAVFYNRYENLTSIPFGAPIPGPVPGSLTLPINLTNDDRAESYGVELTASYQLTPNWMLRGNYSHFRLNAAIGDPGGSDPHNQFYGQSSWTIATDWDADLIARYVDSLPGQAVPSYFEMDARLAWRPNEEWEFAVVGRNLLNPSHAEFGNDTFTGVFATEAPREIYASATLRY